jgi:hypothetical protein
MTLPVPDGRAFARNEPACFAANFGGKFPYHARKRAEQMRFSRLYRGQSSATPDRTMVQFTSLPSGNQQIAVTRR